MVTTENVTAQINTKQQEAKEMIKLFLSMTALDRAKVFGYAQGIESVVRKVTNKRSV